MCDQQKGNFYASFYLVHHWPSRPDHVTRTLWRRITQLFERSKTLYTFLLNPGVASSMKRERPLSWVSMIISWAARPIHGIFFPDYLLRFYLVLAVASRPLPSHSDTQLRDALAPSKNVQSLPSSSSRSSLAYSCVTSAWIAELYWNVRPLQPANMPVSSVINRLHSFKRCLSWLMEEMVSPYKNLEL